MKLTTFLSVLAFFAVSVAGVDVVADEVEQIKLPPRASAERMKWFNELKFGMFIHWGPWSQTEIGGIWQIVKNDTPEQREERFELYRTFNPIKFDPAQWAKVAKNAGMKYVVFVAKHHDGFCNFDTAGTDFKITNPACPYSAAPNPDIVKQVVEAFSDEGLAVGLYFSHIDWHHADAKYFSDSHWLYDKTLIDTRPEVWKRCIEFEKGQVRELLTNYGPIDILWFDLWWPWGGKSHPITHPRARSDIADMVTMARTLMPEIIINDRGIDLWGDFKTPEQTIPDKPPRGPWETSMTLSEGGGYWYKGEQAEYKSAETVLRKLAEIASKGGNFLLNVAPRPDGTLVPAEVETLAVVGKWLDTYGEAIYGTERSRLDYKPDWGYVTSRDNTVYLIVFNPPKNKTLTLRLEADAEKTRLLKDGGDLAVESDRDKNVICLTIDDVVIPEMPFVVAVELKN